MRQLGTVLGLLFLALPRVSLAQTPNSPVFIMDLVKQEASSQPRSTVVSLATLNEALANIDPPPNEEARALRGSPVQALLDLCQPDPKGAPPRKVTPPLIKGLFDCFDCVAAYQETRFTVSQGDLALLFVLFSSPISADDLKPFFSEVPRSSELVATAKALRSLLVSESKLVIGCQAFVYQLQRKRSFLKVVLPLPGAGDELVSTGAAAKPFESPEVTVGPSERWFFSADFSISKASAKIGKTPTPKAEELKSKDFFVALNFALADLLVDRKAALQRRGFLSDLLIKLQATPSREPWESWAAGIGIRGYRLKTILWNFDVVHPYFTVGRQSLPDKQRKWRAVFGFGFDPRSLTKQE